jgi:hypothetical protein
VEIAGFSIQKIGNESSIEAELSIFLGAAPNEVKTRTKTLTGRCSIYDQVAWMLYSSQLLEGLRRVTGVLLTGNHLACRAL